VFEAQIGGYKMSKVFMDGGSGINLIFDNTLRAMRVPLSSLEPFETTFHCIVPGKAILLLGKMALDVIFGKPDNFRRERLDFVVVNWPSQYHVILGRVAFARFLGVPHYAYLMLKMLGPHGVITSVDYTG
jgi:uracil-DNA glycosylase